MSGAADVLELTQSTAGKRSSGGFMPRCLGGGVSGVRATDAGRLLYPEAKPALASLLRAASVVTTHVAHGPTLSLATSHTIGGFLPPGWLASFRAAEHYPNERMWKSKSHGVLAAVTDGHGDVSVIESLDAVEGPDAVTIQYDEIVALWRQATPWSAMARGARRRACHRAVSDP